MPIADQAAVAVQEKLATTIQAAVTNSGTGPAFPVSNATEFQQGALDNFTKALSQVDTEAFRKAVAELASECFRAAEDWYTTSLDSLYVKQQREEEEEQDGGSASASAAG